MCLIKDEKPGIIHYSPLTIYTRDVRVRHGLQVDGELRVGTNPAHPPVNVRAELIAHE